MLNEVSIDDLQELINKRQKEFDSCLNDLRVKQREAELLQSSIEYLKKSYEAEKKLRNSKSDNFQEVIDGVISKTINEIREMSYADLVENVLKINSREMKISEIYELLIRDNHLIKGKNPQNTLRGVISNYKKRFYKKNGFWGLMEWKKEKEKIE